ncbi:MAG: response regulator [Anaerolineales bacterium]|nr:response regulator [Anaerolineales bacterium]
MRDKVLVIDSNPFILSIVKSTLESAGYRVFTALDSEGGLEQFRQRQPDLVILDVVMPQLNGWEICSRIRKQSKTPIIVHTTVESADYLFQAAKLGVSHYLVKPVLPKILRTHVEMALKPHAQGAPALPQRGYSLTLPEPAVAEYA